MKINSVVFLGGADFTEEEQPYKQAFETAKLLAESGLTVINGGGPGVMRASTRGAHKAGGRVIGVTYYPSHKHKNYEGIDDKNNFDEEVKTQNYFDRTKVMLEMGDVHILFKGGTGTISEFGMTWASSRIHYSHRKPILLFGEFWNEIIAVIRENMYVRPNEKPLYHIVETPEEVLEKIKELS